MTINEDDVPLYHYVLVDYDHPNDDFNAEEFAGLYQFNNYIDQQKYGSDKLIINYDQTVWQKQLDYSGNYIYRAISRLNSILPNFTGPATYFEKGNSLVTFQRLNAFPVVQNDVPKTYQAFGTTSQDKAVISFDAEMVKTFNNKYPARTEEHPEYRNVIPMILKEGYNVSEDDSYEYEQKIINEINISRQSIDESVHILQEAEQIIEERTNSIKEEILVIQNTENLITASVNQIQSSNENIDTNDEIINEEKEKIIKYNQDIDSSRIKISDWYIEIGNQNQLSMQTLPVLIDEYENLVYYTEMKTWYLEVFLPNLSILTVSELPIKLRMFNTDTLEYPTH